ncbi:MAG TPA: shikimate kinase [Verrucomicrobiales bacterium]|nr:shikimate kinase [Verrucomicrobiales bacterium]
MPRSSAVSSGPRNVLLVGMMGCGKSSVAKKVAAGLGFRVLDSDELVVKESGMSIPEIFAKEGEEGFRERESAVLAGIAGVDLHVISTGGGIVLRPENRARIGALGFVIWLAADVESLARRLRRSRNRPLINVEDRVEGLRALLDLREELYREVADLIVDTSNLTLEETVHGIIESTQYHFATLR